MTGHALRGPTALASAAAWAVAAHTALNLALLHRPRPDADATEERVAVLLPVRDEAHRVAACVAAVLAQEGVGDLALLVGDDGSTDGTAAVVRAAAAGDRRVQVVDVPEPPDGWLGKPHALALLADLALLGGADVLVCVDADVVLHPRAVAASVALLRERRLGLLSPYPRLLADGPGPRLVQPLLPWSWAALTPVRLAERGAHPSLVVVGGQLVVLDAGAYADSGGHRAVRGQVLEDLALGRAVVRAGHRAAVADGSALAGCRMYDSWAEVAAGYGKSLHAAGPLAAAAAVALVAAWLWVAPWAVASAPGVDRRTRALAAAGAAAGPVSRALVARRTGTRVLPDALAHPVSVLAALAVLARSHLAARRGSLTWAGRAV